MIALQRAAARGFGESDWQWQLQLRPRTRSHSSDRLIVTMVIPLSAFSLCWGGPCLYATWSVRAFKFICVYSEINRGAH